MCPQTGAYGTPPIYGFNSGPGDEDCLYLNIYAAPNATNVPVFLWIRELFAFAHTWTTKLQVLTTSSQMEVVTRTLELSMTQVC